MSENGVYWLCYLTDNSQTAPMVHTFSIYFFDWLIKNPQTTNALTFLTHIILAIGGVFNLRWLYFFFFFFKYIFIFIYNSYGLIVEEFFALFCSLTIFFLWLLFGCTFLILPGKKGINYYMCTGENPRNDFYTTKKVRVPNKNFKHFCTLSKMSINFHSLKTYRTFF